MLKIFLATILVAHVAYGQRLSPPAAAVLPNQQGLAHLFFSSRVTAQDPKKSMACFADYIAHSNSISETYSTDYNQCLVKATDARSAVTQEVLSQRVSIEHTSVGVCERIKTCNEHKNTLDMLNCHAKQGANNTKETYTVSGNASEYATFMQERYRLIDLQHNQCCHAAERSYVEQTAGNYNYLQSCLDGRAAPRPLPSTTTTTTSTSTKAPTTTTTTTTTSTTTAAPVTEAALEATTAEDIQSQFEQLLNMLN